MRWEQTEFILKGIYLGLLVVIGLFGPSWLELGQVALWTLGGLALCLVVAGFQKVREGYRIRGRLMGFLLFLILENPGEPRMAQVSMNLVDWERTGIPAVVHAIRRMAREAGTDVAHCELIGLAPAGALLEVAADALGLRGFSEDQALELRLARER